MAIREIVFRGKRIDSGEWVYGYYVNQYGAHMIYIPDIEKRGHGFDHYHVFPKSISEFTGLTDKNGKKIFEGDIVEIVGEEKELITEKEQKFVVKWQDEDCGFNLLCWFEYEVIGNIHDNPELLKSGAQE